MVAMLLLVELSLYCCCTLFQALDLASEAYVALHTVADFGEMWTRNANIPGPLRIDTSGWSVNFGALFH